MTNVGDFSLTLALMVAAYAFLASLFAARGGAPRLNVSAINAQHILTLLLSVAMAAALYAFISRDFSIEYVASYSSRDMSLFYTVAALWGGQKGSLLLWAWLLALFGSIVILQNKNRNQELMPYVRAIVSGTALFFLVLLVFLTPMFERLVPPAPDGRGLNPLLRNADMVSHPVTLYLGFVGFTIPFAFALSALITGKLDDQWLHSTRRWTIFSWFFLMLGNLFGAQWAYVELGWGGFWAWDPVENASFMPWLTGTAYLHSVMIQEKRGMLKVWNMVLIIITFFLTILGTFITRSGIISSVHSFGQSSLGPFFFGFMGLTLFISLYFLFIRLPLLKSRQELDAMLSRESSFLINNLLLVGITFAVFWGTIFPLISEAVRGVKITVGPPFFNQVTAPLGLALLLITGICPLISWRRASAENLVKNFRWPFGVAVLAAVTFFILGIRDGYGLAAFTLSVFVVTTITLEFARGTAARSRMTGEPLFSSFFNLVRRNKRRYGGYVVHVGAVLMIMGVTGQMLYKVEAERSLKAGESATLNQYTLTYEGMSRWQDRDRFVVAASLSVFNQGQKLGTLVPEKAFYPKEEQPITEIALRVGLKEDLYAILAGWDDKGTVHFKFLINPLVVWLWIGGFVMTLGAIIVMCPDYRPKGRGVGE